MLKDLKNTIFRIKELIRTDNKYRSFLKKFNEDMLIVDKNDEKKKFQVSKEYVQNIEENNRAINNLIKEIMTDLDLYSQKR